MAKIGKVDALKELFHNPDKEGKELRKEFLDALIKVLGKHKIELTKLLTKQLNKDNDGGQGAKFP